MEFDTHLAKIVLKCAFISSPLFVSNDDISQAALLQ
jgi:hypothetical protein